MCAHALFKSYSPCSFIYRDVKVDTVSLRQKCVCVCVCERERERETFVLSRIIPFTYSDFRKWPQNMSQHPHRPIQKAEVTEMRLIFGVLMRLPVSSWVILSKQKFNVCFVVKMTVFCTLWLGDLFQKCIWQYLKKNQKQLLTNITESVWIWQLLVQIQDTESCERGGVAQTRNESPVTYQR